MLGCLFVISAVESVDDAVLEKFDKGHTRTDFLAVAARFRGMGMTLLPTFVPFTRGQLLKGYIDLLDVIAREDSVQQRGSPINIAIRLLIPAGSRLFDLPDVRAMVGPFDSAALIFPWVHEDALYGRTGPLPFRISFNAEIVSSFYGTEIFFTYFARREGVCEAVRAPRGVEPSVAHRGGFVPFLDEPWYCCAGADGPTVCVRLEEVKAAVAEERISCP